MKEHNIKIDPFGSWALMRDTPIWHKRDNRWDTATDECDFQILLYPERYQALAKTLKTSVRIAAVLANIDMMFATSEIEVTPTLTKHLAPFVDVGPSDYAARQYHIKPDCVHLFTMDKLIGEILSFAPEKSRDIETMVNDLRSYFEPLSPEEIANTEVDALLQTLEEAGFDTSILTDKNQNK